MIYVKLIQYEQYWAPRVSFILLLKAFEILTCLSLKMPMTLGAALDYLWAVLLARTARRDRGTVCFTELLWELVLAGQGACPYKPFVVWRSWHPHPSLLETPTSLTQYRWCQAPSASSRWGLNEQRCKAKQYSNRNGRTGVVSGGGGVKRQHISEQL